MASVREKNARSVSKAFYNVALNYYRNKPESKLQDDIIQDRSLWFSREQLISIYNTLLEEGVYS